MKHILITGATSGIGFEAAKLLVQRGHRVLLHGRNAAKLEEAVTALGHIADPSLLDTYAADLSDLSAVYELANAIIHAHDRLDVLINNAGVYKTSPSVTSSGHDVRFVVNTFAPYLLTRQLLPIMTSSSRVLNLSSAAQRPVDLRALSGKSLSDDFSAYAQSKLAITMWSQWMAEALPQGPLFVAINPGSMLGTKMVQEGFGVRGHDVSIGAKILVKAALDEDFAPGSGLYFDNDAQRFASPHVDTKDAAKVERVVRAIESAVSTLIDAPLTQR